MVLLASCQKKEAGTAPVVQGSIDLEVHAVHHTWDVSGIFMYLKRNAADFPGTDSSIYDFKGQADGYGRMTFEHLYPGTYYVYASGYDSRWGDNVRGEQQVVLNGQTVVDNKATLTLYVSE